VELVYLWVEDYKNIKKQGFNFSPRFHCEFRAEYEKGKSGNEKLKDNCELIIEDKQKDYFHIFPENINVTAIVGKNGSGKSSVLQSVNSTEAKIIYFKNGKLYSNHPLNNLTRFKTDVSPLNTLDNIIFMDKNFYLQLPHYGLFSFFALENKNLYNKYFDPDKETINIQSFHKKILELILGNSKLSSSFFNPNKIEITFNRWHKHFLGSQSNTAKDILTTNYKDTYKIYLKSLEIANDKDMKQNELKQTQSMKEFLNNNEEIAKFDILDSSDMPFYLEDGEEKIDIFLEKFTFEYESIKLLRSSHSYPFKTLRELKILEDGDDYKIFLYLVKIGFLEYDFIDGHKRFSSLSTGEKNFFSDFNILNNRLKDNENDMLIFLDEPDTTLHPEWQKKYMHEIFELLKKYNNINFHLVITSHSPFLLSDIPSQNVIFLDKDENGNCKVIDGLKDKKQTFGANIHTLLSDAFFMEDGLIGEFAKEKINKVIELLNQKELSKEEIEYCENIISIIGEPIIKRQLQKMLDSKRLSKIDKISEIENQIAKMQEELNILKAKQNG